MSPQQNLFPPEKSISSVISSPRPDAPAGRQKTPRQTPRWLEYLELSVRVVVRLYLGLVLVVLPWTHFWSANRLLQFVPHLLPLVLNGATRGIVSGLGFLNMWIGVSDAIHFRQS